MGMTITEKILADHAEKKEVSPGEIINVKLDIALGNDVTAPIAIRKFRESGAKDVFDKEKVVLVPDHFTPNKDILSATQAKILREFAQEYNISHYYELGEVGIEHALLPEQGVVLPGDVIIGADSHTCTYGALGAFSTGVGSTDLAAGWVTGEVWLKVPETIKFLYHGKRNKWVGGKDLILYTIGKIGVDGALYKAMEFKGSVIESLPMSDRFSMTNMAVEAGAKNGIIPPDDITIDYIKNRTNRSYKLYYSDSDAKYAETYEIDVSKISPQVALPSLPENTKGVSELPKIELDQVFIGSCTNGRIEDLRIAAKILKGKKRKKYLRLIVIPATPTIYKQAIKEGLVDILTDAGAVIGPPTCGPCLGGHMGVLAKGEKALSTTNRNFIGRMGDPESEVYLTSPAVAAASAVTGYITHPDEVFQGEE